jgi:TonB family protein
VAEALPGEDFGGEVVSAYPRPETGTRESLIVLSNDSALVETLQVLGHDHDIFTVGVESDLAAQLIAEHAGVAILDAAAVTSPIEKLTDRLKTQFPDLVLIVAGGVDDQSALAAQITGGTVYRFLHKPVSEQRVRLFVEAAWRRHGQEHAGVLDAMATTMVIPPQRRAIPPALLVGGGAALGALALLSVWLVLRKPDVHATAAAGATEATATATARDEVLEGLLARADRAFAAGHYLSPAEENATDLYRQALRRNANDPRAGDGLEKVIDKLLSAAEEQLLAQHIDEAQQLTDQARAIKPDHVRVAFLTAEIGKERERAVLMQARQAAANGNIRQAISVLDGAARQTGKSPLVAEARRELEQKKFDERVSDYLRKSADRMRRGQLIDPSQDNARFYIESALAIAPNDGDVKQAERQLGDRLVGEARKALTAGNADQADRWIQAAADSGISRDDISAMTREEQRVRTAAKADAMARLALLFNQRLSQGRVVDPAGDSAKYYMTQLVQSDATHPSTVLARQTFAARTLDEARGAAQKQDFATARRWLSEAHDAGADEATVADVNRDIASAQSATKQTAPQSVSAVPLQRTRYVEPDFPTAARNRGLSGWVDVQFLVKADGTTANVSIVGAQPVGVFEQSAMDAVRKWHYRPLVRNGQTVDDVITVRVRFALQ